MLKHQLDQTSIELQETNENYQKMLQQQDEAIQYLKQQNLDITTNFSNIISAYKKQINKLSKVIVSMSQVRSYDTTQFQNISRSASCTPMKNFPVPSIGNSLDIIEKHNEEMKIMHDNISKLSATIDTIQTAVTNQQNILNRLNVKNMNLASENKTLKESLENLSLQRINRWFD